MAMFVWNGFYINPLDVSAISTGTDNRQSLAHYMVVHLRDGKEYRVNYAGDRARNIDAARLANMVGALQVEPVTRNELRDLLDKAKDAVRRDIRALREEIKKETGDD